MILRRHDEELDRTQIQSLRPTTFWVIARNFSGGRIQSTLVSSSISQNNIHVIGSSAKQLLRSRGGVSDGSVSLDAHRRTSCRLSALSSQKCLYPFPYEGGTA